MKHQHRLFILVGLAAAAAVVAWIWLMRGGVVQVVNRRDQVLDRVEIAIRQEGSTRVNTVVFEGVQPGSSKYTRLVGGDVIIDAIRISASGETREHALSHLVTPIELLTIDVKEDIEASLGSRW